MMQPTNAVRFLRPAIKGTLNEMLLTTIPENFGEVELNRLLATLRLQADPEIEKIVAPFGDQAIDVCGTGGSGIKKFNTSTAVAFILRAAGLSVIKFGNRSITGGSGSLDFLSALGFPESVPAKNLERLYVRTGLLFLGAHQCYPALAKLREARKRLGVPTLLNYLGPLLNPARPALRYIGISRLQMLFPIAKLLSSDERVTSAIAVRSRSGMDELEVGIAYDALQVAETTISPLRFRYAECDPITDDQTEHTPFLHTPDGNAGRFAAIISGEDRVSEACQSLLLNAAVALLAARRASSINEGIGLARAVIDDGAVQRNFELTRRSYNELA